LHILNKTHLQIDMLVLGRGQCVILIQLTVWKSLTRNNTVEELIQKAFDN